MSTRERTIATRSDRCATVSSSLFPVVVLLRFRAREVAARLSAARDAQASVADNVRQYRTKARAEARGIDGVAPDFSSSFQGAVATVAALQTETPQLERHPASRFQPAGAAV